MYVVRNRASISSSKPPVHRSCHALTNAFDTVPPALWDEQTVSRTNFTFQTMRGPLCILNITPDSLLKSHSLGALHHLGTSHSRASGAPNTSLYMMKDGGAQFRPEQANPFTPRNLHKKIRIRITMQWRISGCSPQPDTRVVDISLAGRKYQIGCGDVLAQRFW